MRTCTKFIEESRMTKMNNIHGFIKYVEDNLRDGHIYSNENNIKKFIDEVDLESLEASDYWERCYTEAYVAEQFENYLESERIELGDKDVYDYIEENKEEFIEWMKYFFEESFSEEVEINKNGLIYVERVIEISKNADYDTEGGNNPYADYLQGKFYGYLGRYWAYKRNSGNVYNNSDYKSGEYYIRFRGYVDPKDVDWEFSILQNARNDDEFELCLKPGAPLQLYSIEIFDEYRNMDEDGHVIWKKENKIAKTW